MYLAGFLQTIEEELNKAMPWMYWKGEIFLFIICFFIFLGILGYISYRWPSNPKVGILRIPLSRGVKIFLSAVFLIATMLVIISVGLPWYLTLIVGSLLVILVVTKL